jgi:hypothetical protein
MRGWLVGILGLASDGRDRHGALLWEIFAFIFYLIRGGRRDTTITTTLTFIF